MEKASEELRFEQAAILRDRMRAIEKVVERQKVVYTDQQDSDVIAMARADGEACVQIFFIRGGKLIGREYFILEGTEDEADSEVVSEFIKQFYEKAPSVPDEVLLPHQIEEARIIQTWLNTKRSGSKVQLRVPRRGKPHHLVKMATENATETLKSLRAQWQADTNRQTQSLAELQEAFGLPEAPNRIECYDISNTQGTASVGSMVVFEQGVPAKSLYRRFNIKTVVGPDDFASMEEVLLRRFRRWEASQSKQKLEKKPDPSFSILPDMLIVDGGKGQLSRAVKILDQFGLRDKVVVTGLAKQEEELFLPDREEPIVLERHSQGLYLVQRVRDEAHRFAITAHRKRRTKLGLASLLDSVPGIGPKRRKALMAHFGSFAAIRAASVEELAAVPGITEQLSQAIKSQLE